MGRDRLHSFNSDEGKKKYLTIFPGRPGIALDGLDSILEAHRLKGTLIDDWGRRLISFDEARRFFAIV